MGDQDLQSVAEANSGLSQWQRVTCTFSAPSKTFEDIKRGNRSWWLPFILIVVVGYIFFAAVAVKIGMQQVVDNQIHLNTAQEEKLAQAPPEQREMATKISLYVTEGAFIANPVLLLAGVALLSLGLWGTINFVFGGKATYGSIFAVWMYASLPGIIKSLLGTVIIFTGAAPESFNIKNFAPTNIGAFLNPVETNKALYAIACSLDVVTIWTLVLLGIGTSMVANVKRNSGYIAVFGWWAIFLLIGLCWDAITKQFSGQEILLALILVAIVVIGIAVLVKIEKRSDSLGN
jgi:cell division protein FtsB